MCLVFSCGRNMCCPHHKRKETTIFMNQKISPVLDREDFRLSFVGPLDIRERIAWYFGLRVEMIYCLGVSEPKYVERMGALVTRKPHNLQLSLSASWPWFLSNWLFAQTGPWPGGRLDLTV